MSMLIVLCRCFYFLQKTFYSVCATLINIDLSKRRGNVEPAAPYGIWPEQVSRNSSPHLSEKIKEKATAAWGGRRGEEDGGGEEGRDFLIRW